MRFKDTVKRNIKTLGEVGKRWLEGETAEDVSSDQPEDSHC